MRSAWRPSMMICSAPSRFAAITPQSPTAPSPTTATILPGPHLRGEGRVVAGAHDVGEREQRRHQRVVGPDRQHDERAVRLRDAHGLALAAVDPAAAPEPAVETRGLQALAGRTRRCRRTTRTARPRDRPSDAADVRADVLDDRRRTRGPCAVRPRLGAIDWYGQRSLPQMQARVTLTRASVGSISRASGTVSTRTSPAPYMTVARMSTPSSLSCPEVAAYSVSALDRRGLLPEEIGARLEAVARRLPFAT